jgi:hypothetical protein
LVEWIRICFQFVANRHRSSQLYIFDIVFQIHHFLNMSLKVRWVLCCIRVKSYVLIMDIIVSKSMVIINRWCCTHRWINIIIVLIIILIIFILRSVLIIVSLRCLWNWLRCNWASSCRCIILGSEWKIYYLWFKENLVIFILFSLISLANLRQKRVLILFWWRSLIGWIWLVGK